MEEGETVMEMMMYDLVNMFLGFLVILGIGYVWMLVINHL